MKECINCKATLEDDELFCHDCGTKQITEQPEDQPEEQSSQEEQFCVHCGKSIEVGSLFCPFCGKPQDIEETKSEEPQPKAEEPEPEQEYPQPEKPQVKEEPKVEESPKEEPKPKKTQQEASQPEKEPTYEYEEEKKSKKWIWILLGVLLVGIIGGGYYLMSQKSDTSNSENNDVTMTTSPDDESALPTDPKEFIKSMYNDFFENRNFDTQNISYLHKYLSPSVVKEIKMECPYDGGEGDFSYIVEFFCDGSLSYERPDYGDKVVYRTIEAEGDEWYKVTNIWDVIKDPAIVHLQVKSVDGVLKIVDINVNNNFTDNPADERISFEEALSVTKEMIIKDGSFIGFHSPKKVEDIMAKYDYKKKKRYYVYRAFNFEPLYYKNCSFEETTEDDFAYSEVPSAGKGGTPSFVGIDNSNVVIELFTKDALDDFLNQMKESGASLIEEKEDGYQNYKLGDFEISVFTNIAWGLHYCIMISKE